MKLATGLAKLIIAISIAISSQQVLCAADVPQLPISIQEVLDNELQGNQEIDLISDQLKARTARERSVYSVSFVVPGKGEVTSSEYKEISRNFYYGELESKTGGFVTVSHLGDREIIYLTIPDVGTFKYVGSRKTGYSVKEVKKPKVTELPEPIPMNVTKKD